MTIWRAMLFSAGALAAAAAVLGWVGAAVGFLVGGPEWVGVTMFVLGAFAFMTWWIWVFDDSPQAGWAPPPLQEPRTISKAARVLWAEPEETRE